MFYIKKNNNNDLRSLSDIFFGDFFNLPRIISNDNFMKTDIKEEDKNYLLEMDIPGFEKEDIKISYDDDYLTVLVEKKEEKETKDNNYLRRERSFGSKSRSFYFEDIDPENIQAQYKNGILSINVPKKEQVEVEKKYIKIE